MSLFLKTPNERPMPRPESSLSPVDASPSVIGAGMKVIGDIEASGAVRIDGTVEGSIRGARQIMLGRTGVIQGDLHADEAILGGRVVGTVTAADRVEIQNTSRIDGDIHTKSIVVSEGGIINGTVRMEEPGARAYTPSGGSAVSRAGVASVP